MLNQEWTKLAKFVDSGEPSYARLRNGRTVAVPSETTSEKVGAVRSKASEALIGLPPVADRNTKVLILGTFPGAASLKARQYYADSRNHFWRLVSRVLRLDLNNMSYDDKCAQLLEHQLGLWDVIESCWRKGSSDREILDETLRDLSELRRVAPNLRLIAFNGSSPSDYVSYDFPSIVLPSSSSSNTHNTIQIKSQAWSQTLNQYR